MGFPFGSSTLIPLRLQTERNQAPFLHQRSFMNEISNFETGGRRPNGFLGLSLNDRTILFLEISLDKTVSVG